jgi:hypothetical protein
VPFVLSWFLKEVPLRDTLSPAGELAEVERRSAARRPSGLATATD